MFRKKVVLYLYSTSNHNIFPFRLSSQGVVLYLYSTSNHNNTVSRDFILKVVLYLYSTSNHNISWAWQDSHMVVLYLYSTSNHNRTLVIVLSVRLSYIFILHQTTTSRYPSISMLRCLISLFYIKPQRSGKTLISPRSCLISLFYIKPQQRRH